MREHVVDIEQNLLNSTITTHFNSTTCNLAHFSFRILHRGLTDETARYKLEHDEIKRHNCSWPNGLNQRAPANSNEHND